MNTFRRIHPKALFVACGLTCSILSAEQITLSTSAPAGNPLMMYVGAISPPLLIQVANDVEDDVQDTLLAGWQTRLAIVPTASAVGQVHFNSPSVMPVEEPPNYLFDSISNWGIRVTNAGDELFAFDLDLDVKGVEVPLAPETVDLLQVDFISSSDASGLFEIFALDGPANSEWTDSAVPVQHAREFVNVPTGMGPVRIGEVLVGRKVGDFDSNGLVDAADIGVLCAGIGTDDTLLDLNEDGMVGPADLDELVIRVLSTQFGDADLNRRVEFADFLALAAGFGADGDWTMGDFDCSGTVEFPDFLRLSNNFGFGDAAVAVPEPSTTLVWILPAILAVGAAERSRSVRR